MDVGGEASLVRCGTEGAGVVPRAVEDGIT